MKWRCAAYKSQIVIWINVSNYSSVVLQSLFTIRINAFIFEFTFVLLIASLLNIYIYIYIYIIFIALRLSHYFGAVKRTSVRGCQMDITFLMSGYTRSICAFQF